MRGNSPAMEVSSPDLGAPSEIQADWLELIAFLDPRGFAPVAELIGQQDPEWNQEVEDIGEADGALEDIAANAVAEIERRSHDLEGAYPFKMSEDGSSLILNQDWTSAQAIYLFSLIISHAVRSELLPAHFGPDDAELRTARDLFQVCATLAAAGHCNGPAYSIGWPRRDKTGFLEKLKEIWAHFGDGTVHDTPLPGTPDDLKDEGIDVIAWWPERDGQPGLGFLIGQVASGRNWKDKSVLPHLRRFLSEWFSNPPVSKAHSAIFIPFTVADDQMRRTSSMHGYVVHRGRLARLAGSAPALAEMGVAPIERLDEIDRVQSWLRDYKAALLERTAA